MDLQSKHLSPYYEYGLQMKIPKGYNFSGTRAHTKMLTLVGLNENYLKLSHVPGFYPINHFYPILRPMSDLTKEIEVNGERFIFTEWIEANSSIGYDPIKELIKPLKEDIRWINHCEYYIVQYLLQWHFNIFDLPPELWIDKNTINKND